MRFTVVTAFPDFVASFLSTSVIGRAASTGALDVDVVDLRDFADGDYRQIDDYAYGGGGMLLMAEPLARAVEALAGEEVFVVYPSPQGAVLHQEMVESLAGKEHLVILCGHYEGVDERFIEASVDLEVSLGDFVLTGGELPALVLIDAVARLLPGVVGREEAVREDSFYRGMLDTPHYTRPALWRDRPVPEVLLGGNHEAVARWRRREAVRRTVRRRPDVVARAGMAPYLSHGVYVLCFPGEDGAVQALEMEVMARTCQAYGARRLLVASPSAELRRNLVGGSDGSSRAVKAFPSFAKALQWVKAKEKTAPRVVSLRRESTAGALHWSQLKRELLEQDLPLLLVLAMSGGTEEREKDRCDAVLQPIRGGDGTVGDLSPSALLSVVLDRFLGWR
jgi:tRNA (guanine37-N1)-methyltransferase